MATNKNITMKQFNGVDYDILYPKTIASQIDDVYSKDETSNLFLPKAGGSMGGILDMNGNRITNLPTPTSNSEPTTKEYVDSKVPNVPPKTMYDGWTKIKTISVDYNKTVSFGTMPKSLSQVMLEVNRFSGSGCYWGDDSQGHYCTFDRYTKFVVVNVLITDTLVYGIAPDNLLTDYTSKNLNLIYVDRIKNYSNTTGTFTLWYR